jgi:hypothetical protein
MRQRATSDAQVTRCLAARTRLLCGELHCGDAGAMFTLAPWRLLCGTLFTACRRRGNHRLGD